MKLAITLVALLALCSTARAKDAATSYVDMNRIWSDSQAGKEALKEINATAAHPDKSNPGRLQQLYNIENDGLRKRARAVLLKMHVSRVDDFPSTALVMPGDVTDDVIKAMDAEDKAVARPAVPSAEEIRLREENERLKVQLAAAPKPPAPVVAVKAQSTKP